jgi:hypothetical protein
MAILLSPLVPLHRIGLNRRHVQSLSLWSVALFTSGYRRVVDADPF